MSVKISYGPVNSLTVEAGMNVNDLIAKAVDTFDIDGALSAHATSGQTLDGEFIPDDGSEVILRNSEPAKKG
jgi:hypothetical protein